MTYNNEDCIHTKVYEKEMPRCWTDVIDMFCYRQFQPVKIHTFQITLHLVCKQMARCRFQTGSMGQQTQQLWTKILATNF